MLVPMQRKYRYMAKSCLCRWENAPAVDVPGRTSERTRTGKQASRRRFQRLRLALLLAGCWSITGPVLGAPSARPEAAGGVEHVDHQRGGREARPVRLLVDHRPVVRTARPEAAGGRARRYQRGRGRSAAGSAAGRSPSRFSAHQARGRKRPGGLSTSITSAAGAKRGRFGCWSITGPVVRTARPEAAGGRARRYQRGRGRSAAGSAAGRSPSRFSAHSAAGSGRGLSTLDHQRGRGEARPGPAAGRSPGRFSAHQARGRKRPGGLSTSITSAAGAKRGRFGCWSITGPVVRTARPEAAGGRARRYQRGRGRSAAGSAAGRSPSRFSAHSAAGSGRGLSTLDHQRGRGEARPGPAAGRSPGRFSAHQARGRKRPGGLSTSITSAAGAKRGRFGCWSITGPVVRTARPEAAGGRARRYQRGRGRSAAGSAAGRSPSRFSAHSAAGSGRGLSTLDHQRGRGEARPGPAAGRSPGRFSAHQARGRKRPGGLSTSITSAAGAKRGRFGCWSITEPVLGAQRGRKRPGVEHARSPARPGAKRGRFGCWSITEPVLGAQRGRKRPGVEHADHQRGRGEARPGPAAGRSPGRFSAHQARGRKRPGGLSTSITSAAGAKRGRFGCWSITGPVVRTARPEAAGGRARRYQRGRGRSAAGSAAGRSPSRFSAHSAAGSGRGLSTLDHQRGRGEARPGPAAGRSPGRFSAHQARGRKRPGGLSTSITSAAGAKRGRFGCWSITGPVVRTARPEAAGGRARRYQRGRGRSAAGSAAGRSPSRFSAHSAAGSGRGLSTLDHQRGRGEARPGPAAGRSPGRFSAHSAAGSGRG